MNMKLKIAALVVPLICGALAYGAQKSNLDQRDVRNPRRLQDILNANFADAESRLAPLTGGVTTNQAFLDGGTNLAYLIIVGGVVKDVSSTVTE